MTTARPVVQASLCRVLGIKVSVVSHEEKRRNFEQIIKCSFYYVCRMRGVGDVVPIVPTGNR
jgi:hypothetical protein